MAVALVSSEVLAPVVLVELLVAPMVLLGLVCSEELVLCEVLAVAVELLGVVLLL